LMSGTGGWKDGSTRCIGCIAHDMISMKFIIFIHDQK
jgi:hypothetical protein